MDILIINLYKIDLIVCAHMYWYQVTHKEKFYTNIYHHESLSPKRSQCGNSAQYSVLNLSWPWDSLGLTKYDESSAGSQAQNIRDWQLPSTISWKLILRARDLYVRSPAMPPLPIVIPAFSYLKQHGWGPKRWGRDKSSFLCSEFLTHRITDTDNNKIFLSHYTLSSLQFSNRPLEQPGKLCA